MWERGELEQAEHLHRRGYEMCHNNRDFLAELAEHVDYRIVTGDLAGALELAERHVGWVEETRSPRRKWRWAVTLGELFSILGRQREAVTIRLPKGLAPEGGPPTNASLGSHLAAEADTFAAAFDERNGNDFVSQRTQELRQRLRRESPAT
jgi:hypothetical protein